MIINSISSVKAIAIDYYGTLVDVGQPFMEIKEWYVNTYNNFSENINRIYMAFFKEHAKLQCSKEFLLGQTLLMNSYKKSCDKYNLPFLPEAFQRLIIQLFTQPPAFTGAQQTIRNWRKSYPVLLLTNADNQILYESIKIQGFEFDFILSSEDLQCNKPNVKTFQKACELLNTPAENVLMIGDSLTEDIYGAMSYGMQAIWINSNKMVETGEVLQLKSICEIETILRKND
jgi:2-haloacid dehalogenase/putative hydrolase of the HAD superfamily